MPIVRPIIEPLTLSGRQPTAKELAEQAASQRRAEAFGQLALSLMLRGAQRRRQRLQAQRQPA